MSICVHCGDEFGSHYPDCPFLGPRPNYWRPIKTAPKADAVLLWWKGCKYPSVGRWVFDGVREGWKCDGDLCVPKNQHHCTHWMPLPDPPPV